jgi:hypothetical protein
MCRCEIWCVCAYLGGGSVGRVRLRTKTKEILLSAYVLQNVTFQEISQSQNYFMTDGQSASLSWCHATIWKP